MHLSHDYLTVCLLFAVSQLFTDLQERVISPRFLESNFYFKVRLLIALYLIPIQCISIELPLGKITQFHSSPFFWINSTRQIKFKLNVNAVCIYDNKLIPTLVCYLALFSQRSVPRTVWLFLALNHFTVQTTLWVQRNCHTDSHQLIRKVMRKVRK